MRIINSPPALIGERTIECGHCRCSFAVTNDDARSVRFKDEIRQEYLTPRFLVEDYRCKVASGYLYFFECPICKTETNLSDNLSNFRVVGGNWH